VSVRASLMVTRLGDALFPRVGIAAVRVLEALGVIIDLPPAQTCADSSARNRGACSQTCRGRTCSACGSTTRGV